MEEKGHRSTINMDDETFEAWKASGRKLIDLVKRALALEAADVRIAKAAGPIIGDEQAERERKTETLDKLGRRVENLCAANEGLLTLLTAGYTLQAPVQPGEQVITGYEVTRREGADIGAPNTPPHAHTKEGPADCRRCELLRENAGWMEAEQARLSDVAREVADDDGHGGPF